MIYLDTGCFVKLYYPEPESPQVIASSTGCSKRLDFLADDCTLGKR